MLDKVPGYNINTGKMTFSDPPTKEELWVKSHVDNIRKYTRIYDNIREYSIIYDNI